MAADFKQERWQNHGGRGAQQESRGLTLKGQPRRVRILISMRAAGLGVAAVATV